MAKEDTTATHQSSSNGSGPVHLPKNAQAISLLLQSMGVEDAEPRVVHQLLELTFRTTVDYLENAAVYAEHAGRSEIQVEDVKMAIQSKINAEFTGPPPRELMAEIAADVNKEPLPIIPEKFGIRTPPEKFCLTQPNYSVLTGSAYDIKLEGPAPSAPSHLPALPSSFGQRAAPVSSTAQPMNVVANEDDDYDA